MRFAKAAFTLAGVYGAILMTAMYFAPPQGPPEIYYGFVGVTLAFQLAFLVIGRDPVRFRPLMPVCLVEKALFPAAVFPLAMMGRTHGPVIAFAGVDVALAVLFVLAWMRTPKAIPAAA